MTPQPYSSFIIVFGLLLLTLPSFWSTDFCTMIFLFFEIETRPQMEHGALYEYFRGVDYAIDKIS